MSPQTQTFKVFRMHNLTAFGFVRITVSHRVRDRVSFRDRDRRSEAINFGANSDRRSEPNTVLQQNRRIGNATMSQ